MTIPETSSLNSLNSSYLSSFTSFVTSTSSKVSTATSAIAQNIFNTATSFAGFACKAARGSYAATSSFNSKHPTVLKTGLAAVAILGIGYAVKANLPRLKAFLPK